MKVNFYNTFELVIPLWRYLIPYLSENNIEVTTHIVNISYRNGNIYDAKKHVRFVKVPKIFGRKKLIAHLIYYVKVPFIILFSKKSDLNIFFTQPPLFYLIGGLLSSLRNIPYYVYIMDFYPDIFYKAYKKKETRLIYRLMSKLSVISLNKANRIISIGSCMNNLLKLKGIDKKKIIYIPNLTDQKITPVPLAENKLLKSLIQLRDKFIILYSGNMGVAHRFDTLLSVSELLNEKKDILFLFVGKGYRKNEIESFLKAKNVNSLMLNDVTWDDLPHLLSLANIHYISLREDFTGLLVPSKFYSSLATGKPIIFEGKGEISDQIKLHNTGVVISEGDKTLLKDSILSYYSNKDLLYQHGKNARDLYLSKYELNAYSSIYFNKIQKEISKVKNECNQ